MILVCPQCKASYLVPATVFAHGARNVRCARCANTWLADLPSKIMVMPTEKTAASAPARTPSSLEPNRPVKRETLAESPAESPAANGEQEAPHASHVFSAANLPAIWRNPHWRKVRVAAGIAGGILVLVLLIGAVNDRFATAIFPTLSEMFEVAGAKTPAAADEGLSLRQIRSERRFEDGAMKLVVEGEVHNTGGDTLQVPGIQAKALGPDRAVIQSWRIEAPVATLPPGATAPFHSSIVAPEGSVVEVNLSFADHD